MLLLALLAGGCNTRTDDSVAHTLTDEPAVTDANATADALRALSRRRIYFAHQSVGNNVLQGVQAILTSAPGSGVRIIESRDPSTVEGAGIIHFAAGSNGNPASKNADFIRALDARAAPDNGIALLKYCYVDVDENTDIDAVFREYEEMVAGIRRSHPDLTVVHVTMPLTTDDAGPKAVIKRLIGRTTNRDINALRNRYNQKLRAGYAGEPIFDLATIESTRSDGSRESATMGGSEVFALVPGYTYDGGHLTPDAERVVAESFIRTLADIARGR
ncbi:MAG: hypothetical protein LBG44_06855 [Gemmatimonadota bacterium]|jgi:lysophospholipase L1-like esterase|nr:hypothetical protein [Gemmatimonadota bacterium]